MRWRRPQFTRAPEADEPSSGGADPTKDKADGDAAAAKKAGEEKAKSEALAAQKALTAEPPKVVKTPEREIPGPSEASVQALTEQLKIFNANKPAAPAAAPAKSDDTDIWPW